MGFTVCVWQFVCEKTEKFPLRQGSSFCGSLVVKSELIGMSPEELKFETNRYFCCIHIDRLNPTKMLVDEMCTFSTILGQLASSAGVPFKCGRVHRVGCPPFQWGWTNTGQAVVIAAPTWP